MDPQATGGVDRGGVGDAHFYVEGIAAVAVARALDATSTCAASRMENVTVRDGQRARVTISVGPGDWRGGERRQRAARDDRNERVVGTTLDLDRSERGGRRRMRGNRRRGLENGRYPL